jgi:hypothetical protein
LPLVYEAVAIVVFEVTPLLAWKICRAVNDLSVLTHSYTRPTGGLTRKETFIYQSVAIIVLSIAGFRIARSAW